MGFTAKLVTHDCLSIKNNKIYNKSFSNTHHYISIFSFNLAMLLLFGCICILNSLKKLYQLNFTQRSIGLCHLSDYVFDLMLFDWSLSHREGITEKPSVNCITGYYLIVRSMLATSCCLPYCKQNVQLPKIQI